MVFIVLAKGILAILGDAGIYPEDWLRALGMAALSGGSLSWALAGVLGIAAIVVWEWLEIGNRVAHFLPQTERKKSGNWRIRELFLYLNPDLAEPNYAREEWLLVGQQVRDALALEHLKSWGRPDRTGRDDDVDGDQLPPPECIKPTYWHRANFTYRFLPDKSEFALHTYSQEGTGLPAYRDLKVNKNEARQVAWNREVMRRVWPDFKKYDTRDVFELFEAASLWFDLDPELPMRDDAQRLYMELKGAIKNGELIADFTGKALDDAVDHALIKHGNLRDDDKPLVTPHTKVKRAALKDWAGQIQEKPRFLFPERRGE